MLREGKGQNGKPGFSDRHHFAIWLRPAKATASNCSSGHAEVGGSEEGERGSLACWQAARLKSKHLGARWAPCAGSTVDLCFAVWDWAALKTGGLSQLPSAVRLLLSPPPGLLHYSYLTAYCQLVSLVL